MAEEFGGNSYAKSEMKTHGEVVISQIDVCRKEFSKEMKMGFRHQTVLEGQVVTVQVPDQRLTAINTTKTLYDLLMYYFDEEFDKKYEEISKKLKNINKISVDSYIKQEQNPHFKQIAEENGTIQQNQLGNRILQSGLNYRAELHRELFQELVLLFKRKNELSGKRKLSYK